MSLLLSCSARKNRRTKNMTLKSTALLSMHTFPSGTSSSSRYWVEKGRSLIFITLNRKTNQNEYLLFEPTLSDFEHELLERIHEDLRDILILSTDELHKDRKNILFDKMYVLLNEYGLTLEPPTLFSSSIFFSVTLSAGHASTH